jgi:hypothetical protein
VRVDDGCGGVPRRAPDLRRADRNWIFEQDTAGRITGTKDPPAGFPERAALDRVRAGGGSEMRQTTVRYGDYLVLTRRRGTETVQVVGSLAALESAGSARH